MRNFWSAIRRNRGRGKTSDVLARLLDRKYISKGKKLCTQITVAIRNTACFLESPSSSTRVYRIDMSHEYYDSGPSGCTLLIQSTYDPANKNPTAQVYKQDSIQI